MKICQQLFLFIFSSSSSNRLLPVINKLSNETECEELPKDVYSLFYFEKNDFDNRIVAFVIFVFVAQFSLLSIILVDLMDYNEDKSWPNPPVNVSLQVRISQYFTIFFAIMTQEDFYASICIGVTTILFRERLQEQEVSWKTFLLGCILKFCIGVFGLFIAMIIILQSSNVIALLANFAAMYVVSLADNAAFIFAESGYITDFLQLRSKELKKKRILVDNEIIIMNNNVRRYIIVFVTLIMLSMNIFIQIRQETGYYFTHSIDFYVGDEISLFPAYYNGEYISSKKFVDGRPFYYQEKCSYNAIETGCCCPLIRYCKKTKRWVWTYNDTEQKSSVSLGSKCDNIDISIQSTETNSYDILDVTLQWSSWSNAQSIFLNEKTLVIKDNECQTKDNEHWTKDKGCNWEGICELKRCDCDDDFIGKHCEYRRSCKVLQIDGRDNGFKDYSPQYNLLVDNKNDSVTYNDRPIYFYEYTSNSFDLMFFGGSRWYLTYNENFVYEQLKTERDLIYFFNLTFSGDYEYEFDFISQQDFGYSPQGLTWYRSISDILQSNHGENGQLGRLQETDAILHCTDCNGDDCGHGKCINGICKCNDGYGGLKCQIPLIHGEYSIYSPSNKLFCNGCFDTPIWFDEDKQQNGTYCAKILKKMIKIGAVDTNIEIGANSTHLILSSSKEKKCGTGDLIRAIDRRLGGKIIHYEEVFLFNSTHVTPNLENSCDSTFKKDYETCVNEKFSDFIDEQFFFKVSLEILGNENVLLE